MIPNRIASLTLVSTCAALVNTIVGTGPEFVVPNSTSLGLLRKPSKSYQSIVCRISFICQRATHEEPSIPKSLDDQIANVKRNLYSEAWLAAPDESEYTVKPFPTNGDRFGAFELTKRLDPENFTR